VCSNFETISFLFICKESCADVTDRMGVEKIMVSSVFMPDSIVRNACNLSKERRVSISRLNAGIISAG